MPERFRFFGFSFFFYSKEHEPIHVHVEGEEGFAEYDYTETGFELRESKGLKASSLKKNQDGYRRKPRHHCFSLE